MEISKEEGLTILLGLTDIAWDEGLDTDGAEALARRIVTAYPDLQVPFEVTRKLSHNDAK